MFLELVFYAHKYQIIFFIKSVKHCEHVKYSVFKYI